MQMTFFLKGSFHDAFVSLSLDRISTSWGMIRHSKIKILPFSVFGWDLFLLRKQMSAT